MLQLPPEDPNGEICAATHVTKPWFQLLLVFSLLAGTISCAVIYAVIFIKFRSSKRKLEALWKENESQIVTNLNKDIPHEVPGIHDQHQPVQIIKMKFVDNNDNVVIFGRTESIKKKKLRSNSMVKKLKLIGSHVKTVRYILILAICFLITWTPFCFYTVLEIFQHFGEGTAEDDFDMPEILSCFRMFLEEEVCHLSKKLENQDKRLELKIIFEKVFHLYEAAIIIDVLTCVLSLIYSAANPVLYAFWYPEFRKYALLLLPLWGRRKQQTGNKEP